MDLDSPVPPAFEELAIAILTITQSPIFIGITLAMFVVGGFRWFATGSGDAFRAAIGFLMICGTGSTLKMFFGVEADIEYSSGTKTAGVILFVVIIGLGVASAYLFGGTNEDATEDTQKIDAENEQPESLTVASTDHQERLTRTEDQPELSTSSGATEVKKTRKIIID